MKIFRRFFTSKQKWKYPLSYEKEYQRELRKLVNEMRLSTETQTDVIKNLISKKTVTLSSQIVKAVKNIYDATQASSKALAKIPKMQKIINTYNKQERDQIIKSAMGVDIFAPEPDLKQILNEWTAENTRLIKSIPDEYLNKLEGIISRGVIEGKSIKQVEDEIKNLGVITDSRARLIACDQIGKLNGAISKNRQTAAGIKFYIWYSSNDEKVRQSHQENDGHTYCWENIPENQRIICTKCGQKAHDPPDKGHPGFEIRCRCTALPVFDIDEINKQMQSENKKTVNIEQEAVQIGDTDGETTIEDIQNFDYLDKKKISETFKNFAQKYKNSEYEYALLVSPDNKLYKFKGGKRKVNIMLLNKNIIKGSHLTHIHPMQKGGVCLSFSEGDFLSLIEYELKTMQAITPKFTHQISYTGKKISLEQSRKIYAKAEDIYIQRAIKKGITIEEMDKDYNRFNEIMKIIAQELEGFEFYDL